MKNNHGITLIEIVIVMIIMILLVTFTVFYGIESIEKAEVTEIYEEMNGVRNAVNSVIMQQIWGEEDNAWLADYYNQDLGNGWYLITATEDLADGEKDISEKFDMESLRRSYMVNYTTGEIMLAESVEILDTSVRTYESVRALVESNKI